MEKRDISQQMLLGGKENAKAYLKRRQLAKQTHPPEHNEEEKENGKSGARGVIFRVLFRCNDF